MLATEKLIDDDGIAKGAEAKIRRADAVVEGFGILDEHMALAAVAAACTEIPADDEVAPLAGIEDAALQRTQPFRPRVPVPRCGHNRVGLDRCLLIQMVVVDADAKRPRPPALSSVSTAQLEKSARPGSRPPTERSYMRSKISPIVEKLMPL